MITLICGCPAAGKTTLANEYLKKGYARLNRDEHGGKSTNLIPKLKLLIDAKKNVVLDNLFPNKISRQPFISVAKNAGVPIECVHVDTSIEDGQINFLSRMYRKYNKFFFSTDECDAVKDQSVFPIVVFFKYRKEFEKPTVYEGFESVKTINFKREWPEEYKNKALILDYDDTLRTSRGEHPWPTKREEVEILPNRKEVLYEHSQLGYNLLGVSNQSAINKGIMTIESAVESFEETNNQLGFKIDYQFCPHASNPIQCYCRKPQTGFGVYFIEKYKLDPKKCLFVGDLTTDKTFAARLNFKFEFAEDFFND